MAELTTIVLLAAGILLIRHLLERQIRREADKAREHLHTQKNLNVDQTRALLGKNAEMLEQALASSHTRQLHERRQDHTEELNQKPRTITHMHRDRTRNMLVLTLPDGQIDIADETTGTRQLREALQEGPVQLHHTELRPTGVALHLHGTKGSFQLQARSAELRHHDH